MNEEDEKYRQEHGVIKELDFVNFEKPLDNIKETEVQYSKYSSPQGGKKMGKGGIAKGIVKASFGLLGAVSGGGWYGAHMATEGVGNIITGAANYKYTGDIVKDVSETIKLYEKASWKFINFVKNFVPAKGNIGDVVFKDGTGGDAHCGNGRIFYENGDYFEGYVQNGFLKKGLYIWQNGLRYLGEFDELHRMTGMGTLIYTDGACYVGEQQAGVKHGLGYQLYKDGAYVGDWVNGLRVDGVLRLENGKCYAGEFINDQPAL